MDGTDISQWSFTAKSVSVGANSLAENRTILKLMPCHLDERRKIKIFTS